MVPVSEDRTSYAVRRQSLVSQKVLRVLRGKLSQELLAVATVDRELAIFLVVVSHFGPVGVVVLDAGEALARLLLGWLRRRAGRNLMPW